MAWEYKREEQTFDLIPEGKHRIRIKSAEKTVSKNGNEMLALQFEVSGYNRTLYHYIVNNEWANRNLTAFFDSFAGIPEGDFNTANWTGKTGACWVKHEAYNDSMSEKVKFFIPASKRDELPPWQDAGAPAYAGTNMAGLKEADDDDLPF